jgi:serine/threonine-protein kinase RsbW
VPRRGRGILIRVDVLATPVSGSTKETACCAGSLRRLGCVGSRVAVLVLQVQTDSHPDSLGDARRQVRGAMLEAGLEGETAAMMEVAVGEALSNVYRHAYASASGPVWVEVLTSESALTVVVRDAGAATVSPAIPPVLPGRTAAGGRGLYLVKRLTDHVDIGLNESGHGVTVRMTTRFRAGEH